MPTEKRSTTFRLSEEARQLLEQLAQVNGVAQTAVLEMAIRQMARRDLPGAPEPPSGEKAAKKETKGRTRT
jgi:predicted transcriptional regulator